MFFSLIDQLFSQIYLRIFGQQERINGKEQLVLWGTNMLTLSGRVTCSVGYNTDLSSNKNISKTARVNSTYKSSLHFSMQEYSISFLLILSLIDFALAVLWLSMFKFNINFGIPKIEFFKFFSPQRVKQNKNYQKLFKIF